MRTKVALSLCALLVLSASVASHAQQSPDPDANARVHFGPVSLNPTIGLTNVGVDNNVFYEPDVQNPKSDFTMTLAPATDVWLRLGRSWLTANLKEDLVYYQKYSSQRTANTFETAELKIPFNRLTLKAGGKYARTSDRPGYEIAARVHHTDAGFSGSAELRLLSKTYVGVRGDQTKYSYDQNEAYFGSNLSKELDRKSTTGGVTIRHQVTPLTSLTFEISRQQDRFDRNPLRDSDSTQASAGVSFDPFALVKGSATFGYRDFRPLNPSVAEYKGGTAAVDLSYVALGSTKIGVKASRDVQYSYDVNQPYYVQTGISGSIAQQIYGPFDVVARAGVQRLAYRDRAGVTIAYPNEVDYIHTYGGGAGYRLGRDVRLGFDVNSVRRDSPNPIWLYHGLVAGMSVTYGY